MKVPDGAQHCGRSSRPAATRGGQDKRTGSGDFSRARDGRRTETRMYGRTPASVGARVRTFPHWTFAPLTSPRLRLFKHKKSCIWYQFRVRIWNWFRNMGVVRIFALGIRPSAWFYFRVGVLLGWSMEGVNGLKNGELSPSTFSVWKQYILVQFMMEMCV